MAKSKITNPKSSIKKVWRVFRYRERFELADDVRTHRKSALDFTRDYVGVGAGNEAVGYQQQLNMLSNGKGEEYYLLYGLYRQLINETSKRSRTYRGYLLDSANEPLSDAQIGRMLKIHAKKMTRLLRRLASVNLLERVDLPAEWDLSQDETPPKKEEKQKDAGAQPSKKRRNSAKNKGFSGRARKAPENSEDARARPKAFKKEKGSRKSKQPNGKQKATLGLTASGCKRKNNGKRQAQDSSARNRKIHSKSNSLSTSQTASTPTATPPRPSKPQESDARGLKVMPFTGGPSGSVAISSAGIAYGQRIYIALGYSWEMNRPEAMREICSFGSQHDRFCRLLANLPPPEIHAILQRGIREARKMSRRQTNRKQGAVWNDTMNKIVNKHAS